MLADQFTDVFREEHRQVRDALLDLIEAFKRRDREAIGRLPDQTVQGVLDARDRSNRAGLDLMQWTKQIRKRPIQVVA